jgi:hypothetical protein
MRRRVLPPIGLALVLVVLAWALAPSSREAASSPSASASAPFHAWAGAYTIEYTSDARGPEAMRGSLQLRGELELRRYARDRAGLVLTRCDALAWTVLERAILGDAGACEAEVVGHEVVLELDRHGALVAVHAPSTLSAPVRLLLHGLAQEIAFEERTEAEWSTIERTPRGEAEARYAQHDARIVRTRTRYLQAGAPAIHEATSELSHEHGLWRELVLTERLDGANVHLRLVRVRDRAIAAAPSIEGWARLVPGSGSSAARGEHLRQRVDGLTREALLAALVDYGDGGRFPDHERFLWRATGLLRLEPELARELEPLFASVDATSTRRALLLDLLASASTHEAQASMRRMLESDTARADASRYVDYVQRLALVPEPDAVTLAWVEARYGRAETSNDRLALAYTLASVARQHGDEAARSAAARLARDVAEATTDRERAHRIRALGATGSPAAEPTLRDGLASNATAVRFAAVEGLARLGAHDAVRTAAGDADADVQAAALRHLRYDASDASALESLIAGDRLATRNVRALIRALSQHADAQPDAVARIARALIAAGHASGEEAAALHQLAG